MTNSISHISSEFIFRCIFTSHLLANRCENRWKGHRAHLKLRNLKELDLDYLGALLNDDRMKIQMHEDAARVQGYGPLVPCSYLTSPRDQKTLCRKFTIQLKLFKYNYSLFLKFSQRHGTVIPMVF